MFLHIFIFCVSSGTQECKILPSSRFFPPAEDHSFSTRLSGQLSLLSVAPYAFLFTLSSFFWVCYNVSDLFCVLMCYFHVCVLCVVFFYLCLRGTYQLTSKKVSFLEKTQHFVLLSRSRKSILKKSLKYMSICMHVYLFINVWVSLFSGCTFSPLFLVDSAEDGVIRKCPERGGVFIHVL